ncbi:MAG TPA: hypothetical protein VFO29_00655 [Candidatus Rubrimentiphilum sp.]|nr:hypothetical protein [Candidatus Rubrimentiphilum sp.]
MKLSSATAILAVVSVVILFGAPVNSAKASPPALKSASPSPANAELAQWKSFFALVLPAALQNFSSMKGDMNNLPFVETYAVTASFPDIVRGCDIDHGRRPPTFWSLGCATPSYTRSRSGDLVRDISASLPASFVRSTNAQGNPVWRDSSITISTLLVLDNDAAFTILVCHDVDPDGCIK